MKPIRHLLKDITKQAEHDLPAIDNFLASKKGSKFIMKLRLRNISILEKEMGVPKLTTKDPIQRMGLWMNRAKKLEMLPDKVPIDLIAKEEERFEKMRSEKAKRGELSIPPQLDRKARREAFMTEIERNSEGKPIQAMDKRGRLLYSKTTNKPIYKRILVTNKPKGLFGVAKIEAYIDHSIKKWEKSHPYPYFYGPLFNDQFEEERATWRTQRMLYREYIAKIMTERYSHKSTNPLKPLRLYALSKFKRPDGRISFFEQECTEPLAWGCPLAGVTTTGDAPKIIAKMYGLIKEHKDVSKLHLYDKYGSLVHEQAA